MADEQTNETPATEPEVSTATTTEEPLNETPKETAAEAKRVRKANEKPAAEQGPSPVLGNQQDTEFDPVAHGQQAALENSAAEQAENQ